MKKTPWKTTVKNAKADSILVALVRGIVQTNQDGCRDQAKYAAFRDRCIEVGLEIPAGYESILFWTLCPQR